MPPENQPPDLGTQVLTTANVRLDAAPADVPRHVTLHATPRVVASEVDAKEFADSIVSTIPIPLLVLETDLRVRTASHTFYETFQVTQEETEGRLIYELGNGQWNIPKLRTLLEEILPDNQVFIDYEVEHTFDGIGHRTMLLNGRRLDHLQLILLVIADITKRKQAEVELQTSYNRAEATLVELVAVQAKLVQQERLAAVGELAAGIAHDFNNILSIIMLHAELGLHTPNLPPKFRVQLSTIAQQSKRAAHLIQQILDFGRGAVLLPQPLDLVPFLSEQVELLQGALSEAIQVSFTYGSDFYIINADATRIQQIFTNLAFNARDAMRDGGQLTISLERFRLVSEDAAILPGMEPGEWIQVSVSDTGIGIPLDALPHLFEPFFTTKEPGKGTGLGLAQVYGLVRQHHGYIDVHSQVGKGTTFLVYLPALEMPLPTTLPAAPTELTAG